ncbi:hypothetical protein Asp14428_20960 [Actinoplanes sp. NBRC 14428]|nr:hypothetical protein Asp14428_20960 [Actinoplanes sp. NBRC 14428]
MVRPDEGGDVFDRYVEVFNKCLNGEGVAGPKQDRPDLKKYERNKEAARKCDHLYPETWMERERRTNPEFADLLRETARCLVDRGHKVTVGGDPIAIRYEDNAGANKAYEDEQDCQRKAFRESVENYRKGGS